MVILRVVGTMLHFVLKLISIVLQAILTFVGTVIAFVGGLVTVIGVLFGTICVLGSLFGLIAGITVGHEFWMMFIGGICFAAIPMTLQTWGQGGICAVKGLLGKI
jgi:hypothetical protein